MTMISPSKCKEWLYVPKSAVDLSPLIIETKDYFGTSKGTIELFEDKGEVVGIPRYFLSPPYPPVEGEWEKYNFKSKIQLRPYQKKIVELWFKKIKSRYPYGGIILMPMGTGKTIVALEIIARMKLPALVVVHTEVIYEQWKKAIRKYLELEAGEIRRDKETIKPITIAMVQTLIRKEKIDYKEFFGLVVYDEVHIMGAKEFNKTIPLFNPKYRLGLSATPYRKDGMTKLFKWHIGEILARMSSTLLVPKIVKIEYSDYISTAGCFKGKKFIRSKFLKRLNIPRRNEIIARLAMKAYQKGYKVLILSDSLSLLYTYNKLLKIKNKAWIIGEKKTYTGKERIILATYLAGGTGFDAPEIDCLILATPRADVKQAIGRALRPLEGKRQPIIIDIVDINVPVLRKYYLKRKEAYKGCPFRLLKF